MVGPSARRVQAALGVFCPVAAADQVPYVEACLSRLFSLAQKPEIPSADRLSNWPRTGATFCREVPAVAHYLAVESEVQRESSSFHWPHPLPASFRVTALYAPGDCPFDHLPAPEGPGQAPSASRTNGNLLAFLNSTRYA